VKEDNLETSGMERKINEMEDEMRKLRALISQANQDLDPNQGILNHTCRKAVMMEQDNRRKECQV
jgi:hypothetical protein